MSNKNQEPKSGLSNSIIAVNANLCPGRVLPESRVTVKPMSADLGCNCHQHGSCDKEPIAVEKAISFSRLSALQSNS